MPPLLAARLVALALLGSHVASAPRQLGEVRDSNALYPCTRGAALVRYFALDGDTPDVARMQAALAELGSEIVYGPRTTSGRPGHAFAAVRCPADEAPKKLALALKKGGFAAHEIVCTAFDGRDGKDTTFGLGGMGFTTRDFVMGLSGDIVWYDSAGAWSQFYGAPGKLKSKDIADRYEKLYAPYGGGHIGRVVRERFTWTLTSAPDDKQRERLLKALRKLDGVEEVSLAGAELGVVVALDGLAVSGLAGKIPSADGAVLDELGKETPRACFATQPLYDLLLLEKLVPAAPPGDEK